MWWLSPVVLACWLLLAVAPVQEARGESCAGGYRTPHPNGVCGRQLRSLVENLCALLNNGRMVRRYMAKRDTQAVTDELFGVSASQEPTFLPSALRKRSTQSLTCACCYNSCNVGTLVSFCPSSGFVRRSGGSGGDSGRHHRRHQRGGRHPRRTRGGGGQEGSSELFQEFDEQS